jgi:N,N'-diacetyllegionaminate synthase
MLEQPHGRESTVNSSRTVEIGGRPVGGGAPVFLCFEGGATHTGFDSARRMIDLAADAGVDSIKFQTVFARNMMSKEDVQFEFGTTRGERKESLYTLLENRELPLSQWRALKQRADDVGIIFFSTPDNETTIDFLAEIGAPAIKIAGGDMNNYPLIRHAARTKLPVLLDTRGTLGELERAVETCVGAGNERIVIIHCPSGYPSAVASIRLRSIELYRRVFPYPVGFSDHSPGWDMDVAAVALGADFIEKTITFDVAIEGPEHIMSLVPDQFRPFVAVMREVEQALGDPHVQLIDDTGRKKMSRARRSVVLTRSGKAGETVTADMITFKRPGFGIAPELASLVVGRRLVADVERDVPLRWDILTAADGTP